MRMVAITNLKGGVGKTTTTVNLGAGMALKGLRVLLVDVDAQGNLATALGVKPRRTLYEVLIDGKSAEQCLTSARDNLDLLAADDSLMTAQPLMAQRPDWAHLLNRALKPLASRYDVALIDCSASLSVMNASALLCATHIVAPTVIEHLAIHGIELLQRQLNRLSTARISCIVPTMYDVRLSQASMLLAELETKYAGLVTAPIRVNVRLSEAPAHGKTIYEYDPRSRGAVDYAILVEHLTRVLQLPEIPRIATPAEQPAQAESEQEQLISFRGETHEPCPTCQAPLHQTVLAGYRVRFCRNCRYYRQELIQGVRR